MRLQMLVSLRRPCVAFIAVAIACIVTVHAFAAGAQGSKTDLSGTWLFTSAMNGQTGIATIVIKQNGSKLTGHYVSKELGAAEISGTSTDQRFTILFKALYQDAKIDVKYAGSSNGKDGLKGTMEIIGRGDGTFFAKRQPK